MQYKLSDAVKETKRGVLIDIHVISQSKEKTLGFNSWEPRIRVKVGNPPLEGRANQEVKQLFKNLLGCCEITSGSLSPKKTLLVEGCSKIEVIGKLEKIVEKNI
ncbi:MAG: DUF167 family protein [Candidatus Altiarchaeota archaeon]